MKPRGLFPALLLCIPGSAAAQAWFDPPRVLTVLEEIREMGDVDLDGDVDLLRFFSTGSFTALFNDGNGRFTDGASIPLGSSPGSLVPRPRLGDVTGDGVPDLVLTVDAAPNGVRLYPGTGGGGFGAFVFTSLPGFPMDFDLRDREGDGDADVAVFFGASPNPSVRWLSWNGSAFSVSAAAPAPFSLKIAAVEATGDGVLDVAVGEFFGPNVAILPTVAGNPTTGSSLPLPGPVGGGRYPTAGDLDGDGDEDLLVGTNDNTSVLRVAVVTNGGSGLLTVGPAQVVLTPPPTFPPPLHVGDWDGDGDLDALAQLNGLRILENDGASAFALAAVVPNPPSANPIGYVGAGVADLNADGAADFVGPASVKFGDGTFHSVLESPYPTLSIPPFRALDWEGDGDPDLLHAGGSVAVNDGTGRFAVTSSLWPAPPPAFGYVDSRAIGDFDGDGRADHLATYFQSIPIPTFPFFQTVFVEMRLLADDGVGGYSDSGPATPPGVQIASEPFLSNEPSGRLRRPVADVDADGDLDFLDGNPAPTGAGGYWPNDGTGFFPGFAPLFAGLPVDAGDVDGDGDLDVLTSAFTPSVGANTTLALERNAGGLSFLSQTLFGNPEVYPWARFLDLDDDGDLDVAAGSRTSQSPPLVRLFANAGGTFGAPVSLVAGGTPFPSGNAQVSGTQDVDGDGLTDLVTGPAGSTGGFLLAFRRIGPGLAYEPRVEYFASRLDSLLDLDGDGDLDAVGAATIFDWRFHGPGAGGIRQYGGGTAGSGGAVPVLGATGPIRPGSATASVRLRRALGGTVAILALGPSEAILPDVPFPGLTTYLGSIAVLAVLPVAGPPGVAGAGSFDLPIPPAVLAASAGTTVFAQAFLFDPAAPFLFTGTNGLEVRFGF